MGAHGLKRAATPAFALKLPNFRTAEVISIRGRQTVARRGIYIGKLGGVRRMLYQQFDGEVVLASECSCATDWQPDFAVARSDSCKIDQHRAEAREKEEW